MERQLWEETRHPQVGIGWQPFPEEASLATPSLVDHPRPPSLQKKRNTVAFTNFLLFDFEHDLTVRIVLWPLERRLAVGPNVFMWCFEPAHCPVLCYRCPYIFDHTYVVP